jgi:hypothetical protein
MLKQLRGQDFLYQSELVYQIHEMFGEPFVYENDHGNLAISRDVLAEFRLLTERTVVWDRSERAWRWREQHDSAGRATE